MLSLPSLFVGLSCFLCLLQFSGCGRSQYPGGPSGQAVPSSPSSYQYSGGKKRNIPANFQAYTGSGNTIGVKPSLGHNTGQTNTSPTSPLVGQGATGAGSGVAPHNISTKPVSNGASVAGKTQTLFGEGVPLPAAPSQPTVPTSRVPSNPAQPKTGHKSQSDTGAAAPIAGNQNGARVANSGAALGSMPGTQAQARANKSATSQSSGNRPRVSGFGNLGGSSGQRQNQPFMAFSGTGHSLGGSPQASPAAATSSSPSGAAPAGVQ